MRLQNAIILVLAAATLGTPRASAQISDDVVRIGVLNDQSGLYADLGGQGSVVAARMAVEDAGGSVLGKLVEIIFADHQNKADIGMAVSRRWFEAAAVDMAIGFDGGKLTIETGNPFLDDVYAGQHGDVEPGQYVMVAISDNGTGMPPDVAARVFDSFFTTKPSGKGTGLGLSQVFGFIKQSHGHIKIYSEVGCGTTVKLYLPRNDQIATAMPMTLPPVPAAGAGEVVLVVEDDPMMLKFTTEAVRELGYTALHADNAAAALAILDDRPDIRLLFTDVVMPDISGMKLADEALVRRPELKVLYTTGYTANAVVHGGVLDAGVNLLGKPFTLEQLAAKLRLVLNR